MSQEQNENIWESRRAGPSGKGAAPFVRIFSPAESTDGRDEPGHDEQRGNG
jgi:hypothetical protein